jgi:hypothetical protein
MPKSAMKTQKPDPTTKKEVSFGDQGAGEAPKVSEGTKELLGRTDAYKGELFERPGKAKSQTSLRAAQIESNGGQIPLAQERGITYDHITKVKRAQRGLADHIGDINVRLGWPKLADLERQALQQELSEASKLLDYTKQFLKRP